MKQVVIVLIDALRADFVLNKKDLSKLGLEFSGNLDYPKINFLADKIENGEALAFVAKATPPTVTLPRIKVR